VVKTLQSLARKGRTIIVTSEHPGNRIKTGDAAELTFAVHQPRSEIWGLFDNIILLSRGSPTYAGSAKDCLPYFAGLGHDLPPFTNPAEYLIDIVSVDNRSEEAETIAQERVDRIKAAWRERSSQVQSEKKATQGSPIVTKERKSLNTRHTSFLQQTRVLTARTFKVTIRDPMGMLGSLVEAVLMAVVTGWIFLQLDGSLSGIRSRQGCLYTAAALQGYLILLYETYRLTIDIQLFDEESRQGVVGIPAFLISRRLARMLIEDLPVPLIFSLIYYFMAGFRTDGAVFLTFLGVVVLLHYIAVCFATLCVAVSRHFAGVSHHQLSEVPAIAKYLRAWNPGNSVSRDYFLLICLRQVWWPTWPTRSSPWLVVTSSRRTRSPCTSDGPNGSHTSSTGLARSLRMSSPEASTTVLSKAAHRTPLVKNTLASSSSMHLVSLMIGSGGQLLFFSASSLPSI